MHEEHSYERPGREHRGGGRRDYGGGGPGGPGGSGGPGGERRGVPLADLPPELTEVSRRVIGCAIDVHKHLGPGFGEEIYAAALMSELESQSIAYKHNHPVPVLFKGKKIGEQTADLLIDNRFIVDLMAQRGEIGGVERAALRALLRQADLELGLIINFAERRLKDGLVRVLNPDKLNLGLGHGEGEEAFPEEPH